MRAMSLWILEGPPYLTFFAVLIALLTSLVSTLANRKLIDRRLLDEFWKEVSEWQTKMEQARRTGDKKLLAKLEKDKLRIMQMRAKVSSQQLKVMSVTFIPFLVVWWLLIPYFYKTAAFIPLIGTKIDVPFFVWYIICSLFFHFLLSKIFK